jgi:hypothetical protein
MKTWSLYEAVELARALEVLAPNCGAHVGLTGGCLYKDGRRKDLDIVVYRIRQVNEIDREKFFHLLRALQIRRTRDYGFVVKARQGERTIDFLFPDSEGSYYQRTNQ